MLTGDSNFHSWEEFPIENGFIDVWKELYPNKDGWTYDSVANAYCDVEYKKHQPGFVNQHRLDRFILKSSLFRVSEMRLLGTSCIGGDENVFPSDHFGILTLFDKK